MSNKLAVKWGLIIAILLGSLYLIYPNYKWYSKPLAEREKLDTLGERPKRMLNLGLDLRGGSSLLLELDVSKLSAKEPLNEAMARAVEIIRNRIDQYGLAETQITRQGDKWIMVQLPGVSNPQRAEELIGKTAMLEFRIVKNDTAAAQKAIEKLEATDKPFDDNGVLIPEIAKLVPEGYQIMRNKETGYSLVTDKATVTGADLENARVVMMGDNGYPEVSFTFNAEGSKKFGQLTGANIGKQLAIILDNTIQSAPVVQARITKDGRISGTFTPEEARSLSIVLKAGALPAPVRVIEKKTIGPTLGEDSIKSGLSASFYAFIVILLFMAIYYKAAGVIADIALLLNFVFTVAIMSYFSATLTLPGIAGMILSLAMAIDANVLIIERMREEKLLLRPVYEIINLGYDKAWSAIFDSNITTIIVGACLLQFGTGPVKGFAVTLIIGLVVSLFTAVFVTRAIYELILTTNTKEISL
ncbi:MAG: protein translocase subunit SecD [Elusimicrobia bacterium]|nr:protein translocase subunit SecD [Elusimicrobiota bacterium]MDD7502188.1 protein translocase subunit SecD [Elusimicrobiota bacterium]MDY5729628.1 protein translocase subunit SecD [Elusimicrobiaceae bacterium]